MEQNPSLSSSLGLCACPGGQAEPPQLPPFPSSPDGWFELPRAPLASGGWSLYLLERSAPTCPRGRESNARESIVQTLLTPLAGDPYSGHNLSWGPRGRQGSILPPPLILSLCLSFLIREVQANPAHSPGLAGCWADRSGAPGLGSFHRPAWTKVQEKGWEAPVA